MTKLPKKDVDKENELNEDELNEKYDQEIWGDLDKLDEERLKVNILVGLVASGGLIAIFLLERGYIDIESLDGELKSLINTLLGVCAVYLICRVANCYVVDRDFLNKERRKKALDRLYGRSSSGEDSDKNEDG